MFVAKIIVGYYCLILLLDYLSHDMCPCVIHLIFTLNWVESPRLSLHYYTCSIMNEHTVSTHDQKPLLGSADLFIPYSWRRLYSQQATCDLFLF